MRLPEELQSAIEHIVQHSPDLLERRKRLTKIYQERRASPFREEENCFAYLGARMPATYAAIHKVLRQIPPFDHLLDLGAGPGTASWAAADLFPSLQKITLIEKSPKAIALGRALAQRASHPALQKAEWIEQSLLAPLSIQADVAVLSYVLNELKNPEALVAECWKAVQRLVIVEPGTPQGFQLIRKVRQQLLDLQAHIIAPCPHALACPIQGSDWCHFSARIERSRLHRFLKEGSLGHEDEKFSYLIVSKNPSQPPSNRIVRRPAKQSGHIRLSLCTQQGKLEEKTLARSNKEAYRVACDAEWGAVYSEFVDVRSIIPDIQVDLKYATKDNFTGQIIYDFQRCLLLKEAALQLRDVQKELETRGLGLKIWDGFRPVAAQWKLWEVVQDERYVSDPRKGGRHTRGTAVDVTLITKEGHELEMPSGFDDFSEKAHGNYMGASIEALQNRTLLRTMMEKYGFVSLPTEWWHFDLAGWENYQPQDFIP